jgi:peptide/nickel transport system ATP-binding protein
MRLGEIVEQGATEGVFSRPCHPYTRELLDAVPGKLWHPTARRLHPVVDLS